MIFWALLPVGVLLVYFLINFRGLVSEEAMEFAGAGRRIAMGKAPAPLIILPSYLQRDIPIDDTIFPRLPPVYCVLQAIVFKIGGYNDNAAVMAGGLFFLAAALLNYLLARRLLLSRIALFVFLFTFTNPVLLRYSINGLPTAFLTFLTVLLFYGLTVLPGRYAAGLAGVIFGLGFLTDYSWSFLLPLFVIYLLYRHRHDRWPVIGIFFAGFFVVFAPWLIGEIAAGRSSYLSGLDLLWKTDTVLFPGRTIGGPYGLSYQAVSLTLPMIIGKLHQGFSLLYRDGLLISGNLLGILFWLSLFFKRKDNHLKEYRLLICLLLIGAGTWFMITTHRPEIWVPFIPMIILLGTNFFSDLMEKFGPRNDRVIAVILAGFIIINCAPIFLFRPALPDPDRNETLISLQYLQSLVREDELIATDLPWLVGWYGRRRAVRIPWNIEMFHQMQADNPGMKYLLLSPRNLNRFGMDPTGQWSEVYRDKALPDPSTLKQVMLLPGSLVLMGKKSILLNRLSSRW